MMKIPTFPYPGGKARIATEMIKYFPLAGGIYVEPFAGRGNVFWRASQILEFKQWWLNDVRTYPFFNALKTGSCDVPERVEAEYYRLWNQIKREPLNTESLLLEPYLTFSGGGYGSGGFGNLKGASRQGYKTILGNASSIMRDKDVLVTGLDWGCMGLEDLSERDFVYFDPPYMSADVRCYKDNKIEFDALIQTLVDAKFRWVLSEYRQPIYVEALGEPLWEKQVQLSVTNTRRTQESRSECLWGKL